MIPAGTFLQYRLRLYADGRLVDVGVAGCRGSGGPVVLFLLTADAPSGCSHDWFFRPRSSTTLEG